MQCIEHKILTIEYVLVVGFWYMFFLIVNLKRMWGSDHFVNIVQALSVCNQAVIQTALALINLICEYLKEFSISQKFSSLHWYFTMGWIK